MSKEETKEYVAIVRLKGDGEYNTLFVSKIRGTLKDPSITVWRTTKAGKTIKLEIASDRVEAIEQEVDDLSDDTQSDTNEA